ncbi:MAG: alpha amylase C-terminal domain-containing protein, partial [Bacteroidota bacterium]
FMGGEFGQSSEWDFQNSLDWHLTQYDFHSGIQETIKDLNRLYKNNPALYEKQFSPEGFQWLEYNDSENTVISYIRKGHDPVNDLIIVCNFNPVPRENYRVGVEKTKQLRLVFNSDDLKYSGSGMGKKTLKPAAKAWNGYPKSVTMTLPPLSVVVYK